MLKYVHKQNLIKLLSILSSLVLLAASCANQSNQSQMNAANQLRCGKTTLANLQYAAALTGESPHSDANAQGDISGAVVPEYFCKDANELSCKVRECMLSRISNFSIVYTGELPETVLTLDTFGKFINAIFSYDDTAISSDYDYLRLSWTKAQLNIESDAGITKYTFSFEYLTTASDEVYIDQNVQKIISTLNIYDSGDYEKIKAVNDYIINHVSFDNSYKYKSAYDALYSGRTICRGYALLAYKMLSNLSIPVRIITGKACSEPHAWNIVEIDGKWYNVDITWDDLTKSDSYFLKDDADFFLHTKDNEFKTDIFNLKFPLAKESYGDCFDVGN